MKEFLKKLGDSGWGPLVLYIGIWFAFGGAFMEALRIVGIPAYMLESWLAISWIPEWYSHMAWNPRVWYWVAYTYATIGSAGIAFGICGHFLVHKNPVRTFGSYMKFKLCK